jgi:hypothetical protein
MTTDYYKLGPGTLTLGTDPDESEFAMQLSNCRVDPTENVAAEDDLNLLDGSTLKGDPTATYSFALSGTAVQDLVENGFTDYCWQNKGVSVAFVFVPVTARAAQVSGTCRITPITIGGPVKTRNQADFTFQCTGTDPAFTPEAAG